jgi:hypothetical protein
MWAAYCSSLHRFRLLPENLNFVTVISPLVKTKPAQERLTQTKPPQINALPIERYKEFCVCLSSCFLFICLVVWLFVSLSVREGVSEVMGERNGKALS